MACPSAELIDKVNFCLLDVSDFERVLRLKKRNSYGADQNMLNWAAWLRMHHQEPQWEQHVIKENCFDKLNFSAWDKLESWKSLANIKLLDTTKLSIKEVATTVSVWIPQKSIPDNVKLMPDTKYKVVVDHTPSQADNYVVMEGLIAFNESVMNEPRDKEFSVFLKNVSGKIFGGIHAHFDRESVYIEVLWVDGKLRKHGYGKKLLDAAEQEAIKNGCKFSITDTLAFQAEAFYLKNGYERIGEIKKYWYEHSRIFFRKKIKLAL